MATFEEILKRPTSEIKAPQPYPVGTYHAMVEGFPEHGKSSMKGTDFLKMKYKILGIREDVDSRAAAEQQVVGKYLTQDFYITDNEVTQNMFKEFLENVLGIENEDGRKCLEELMAESPNRELLVKVKHELSKDSKRVYHRVESTAHV